MEKLQHFLDGKEIEEVVILGRHYWEQMRYIIHNILFLNIKM